MQAWFGILVNRFWLCLMEDAGSFGLVSFVDGLQVVFEYVFLVFYLLVINRFLLYSFEGLFDGFCGLKCWTVLEFFLKFDNFSLYLFA